MTIIYLILLLLVFVFYLGKKHALVLVAMTAIITSVFGFIGNSNVIQKTDLLLLPTLFIVFNESFRNKNFFKIKGDIIAGCIVTIITFITLEYVFSIVLSIESPVWAYKVVRGQYLFLLYFYFRSLDKDVWQLFFKLVLFFSFIQGIFFYLQLIGLTGILAKNPSPYEGAGLDQRYCNYPDFTIFFIIYFISKQKISLHKRVFMLMFWGTMILLSQSRGPLLGIAAAIVVYIIYLKKMRSIPYLIAAVFFYFIIVSPIVSKRDKGENVSSRDDISLILNSSSVDLANTKVSQMGSIAFRFGMLTERMLYLVDNPQYILWGVGCIHEQSPSNRFEFYLGTVNEKYDTGRCQIDSGDITWVPLLLRYGLIGVLIYIFLLYRWIKISYTNICDVKSSYARASGLMSVCVTISTIGAVLFDNVNTLFFLCIYLGMLMSDYTIKCKRQSLKCV